MSFALADGTTSTVEITVREVQEKVLPPLDDDLARAASEFDTLGELRASIEGTLREQLDAEVDAAFRVAAVDELVRGIAGATCSSAHPQPSRRSPHRLRPLARAPRRLARDVPRGEWRQRRGAPAADGARGGGVHLARARSRGTRRARGDRGLGRRGEGVPARGGRVGRRGGSRRPRRGRVGARPAGVDSRGSAPACRARPSRRRRQADRTRPRGRARQALDTRQGKAEGDTKLWTPGSKETPE